MTGQPNAISSTIDIHALARLLWGRRWQIIGIMVFFVLLALLYIGSRTPVYTARTLLLLDNRKPQLIDFQAVLPGLTVDEAVVQGEMAILRSSRLVGRVAEKLDLYQDPEFSPAAYLAEHGPGLMGGIKAWLRRTLRQPDEYTEEQKQALNTARTHKVLLDRLQVSNSRESYVIALEFTAQSADKAASIANVWADLYLEDQLEAKFEATRRANAWLVARLDSLQETVKSSSNAVAAAREKYNVVESAGGETLVARQLQEVNSQLILAQTERAQAEARSYRARSLARQGRALESSLDVLTSPLIQRLREQEATLLREEADLSSKYGPRHPSIVNVRAEIRDLRAKINEEVSKIVKSLDNEVAIARAREATLRQNLAALEEKFSKTNRAQIEIGQLQRERDANQILYDNFLERSKQTGIDDLQQADARVIETALPPLRPSQMRAMVLIIGAGVLGGIVGVLVVIGGYALQTGLRTQEEVEAETGLPAIAMVPMLDAGQTGDIAGYLARHITAPYAQSFHNILAFLDARSRHQGEGASDTAPVVLVTSSVPEEGKSVLSYSLALVAAHTRKRVLLLDGDIRRPRLHVLAGIDNQTGLTACMTGRATWEDCQQSVAGLPLTLAPNAPESLSAMQVFGGGALGHLLDVARRQYDLIIIDAPPVLAGADAVLLSEEADHVLFAARYAKTGRKIVANALHGLRQTGNDVPVSVVLTQVLVRQHVYYGYGDTAFFYGKYGDYYKAA